MGAAMSDPLDQVRRVMAAPEDVDMGGVPSADDFPDEGGDPGPDIGDGWGPDVEPPEGPPRDPPEGVDLDRHIEAAAFPLNDIGNGKRFCTYFGEDVMFVPRVGWFAWDGCRWAKDSDELVVRGKAQKVSELMLREIEHMAVEPWEKKRLDELPAAIAAAKGLEAQTRTPEQDAELDKLWAKVRAGEALKKEVLRRKGEYRRFAKSTGNTGKIDAMKTEAAIGLAQQVEALDSDPLAVNTLTGTLKFSVSEPTGEGDTRVASFVLHRHDRADRLTKCMTVAYDPHAQAPRFEAFMQRIMPDAEIRRFLQRSFGLAMTARMEQRIWFLYGHGANGKSSLIDLMAKILGDYSATAKIETLTGQTKRGGADATPDLIPLMGARMVRASEPEQGERLKEGLIKEMTGGEAMLIRALHSDFIEVRPVFKLFISGNHKPEIRGTDDGIWRRVLMVPFKEQIPEKERDIHFGEKLYKAEAAGILNWMIDGLISYLENGLQVPKAVAEATQAYREENDPIGIFLDACCEVRGDAGTFTRSSDLTDAFNFYQAELGSSQWTGRQFQLRLKDKAERWRDPRTGLTFMAAKRSVAGYQGIALTDVFRRRMDDAVAAGKWKRGVATSTGSAASGAGDDQHDF
jgi:putative DNA primase/helicase